MTVCELYKCNDCGAKYVLALELGSDDTIEECGRCGSEKLWPVREEED